MSVASNAEMETIILDPLEETQIQLGRLRWTPRNFFGPWSTRAECDSQSDPQLQAEQNSAKDPKTSPSEDDSPSLKPFIEQSPDLYRDPKKIPGVRPAAYAYPHADACISAEHRKRFPVIIDIFQQNLNEHKKLSLKHPTKTEYKLKMCGTGIDDAKPSILVCHPQNDPETGILIIRSLSKSHVRKQYDSRHVNVQFGIYLFLGPAFNYLGLRMEPLNIRMKDTSFSGATLVSGDAGPTISTIACGVKFFGTHTLLFGLTSAHAFDNDEDSTVDTQHNEMANPLSDGNTLDDESEDEDVCVFADVEYDLEELMRYDSIDEGDQATKDSVQPEVLPKPEHNQPAGDIPTSEDTYITPTQVWGRRTTQQFIGPNLDWALIGIEKSEQWEVNNIRLPLQIYNAPDAGCKAGSVLVMTSRGPLSGTICHIPSFIANSSNNSHLGQVWSVTLKKPGDILVGDSGALVLDALTKRLYGYVIAVNHFREIYTMPLDLVLKQLSDVIPNSIFGRAIVFMDINLRQTPITPVMDSRIVPSLTKQLFTYWPVNMSSDISIYETEPQDYKFPEAYDSRNAGKDIQHKGKTRMSETLVADYASFSELTRTGDGSFISPSSQIKTPSKFPTKPLGWRHKVPVPPTRVLLVGDDPINSKLLSAYMKKYNIGFRKAKNGEEAVEFFKLSQRPAKYTCILMNLSMSDIDGFETARQIRAYEAQMRLTPVSIIAFSTITTEDTQQQARESGIDEYLTLPLNLGALTKLFEPLGILNGGMKNLLSIQHISSTTDETTLSPLHVSSII